MIGIIGSMSVEVEAIKSRIMFPITEKFGGFEYTRGTMNKKKIVVAICGIGKVFAALCAQSMIIKYSPDIIINTGVSGALKKSFNIGDIVIGENVVQHDLNLTPLGVAPGYIQELSLTKLPCDESAVQTLKECAGILEFSYHTGTLASGDLFVTKQNAKNTLKREFGAVAADMESAAIAITCKMSGIPFAVIRAISDSSNDESQDVYTEFLDYTASRSIQVVDLFIERCAY